MVMLLAVLLCFVVAVWGDSMPLPWTRELQVESPLMNGSDVIIAQNLLIRDDAVDSSLTCDGIYGSLSAEATKAFQSAHDLAASGVLDSATASLLLSLHSNDQYKDTGFTAASMGYLYKLFVPVHYNRSIGKFHSLYNCYFN